MVNWYGFVTAAKLEDASGVEGAVKMVKDATDLIGAYFYEISIHKNWAREVDGLADQVTV